MSKFTYIGKVKRIDHELGEITISLDFVTPEDLYLLEELVKKQESRKFSHTKASIDSQSYKLQKAWYGSLAKILRTQEIFPTHSMLNYFDEEMRKSIFPCKEIDVYNNCEVSNKLIKTEKTIPIPKRLKELNNEERYQACIRLQDMYSFVDWSGFWD